MRTITNNEESISELIDYYLKEISDITGISKETLGELPASSITDGTLKGLMGVTKAVKGKRWTLERNEELIMKVDDFIKKEEMIL